MWVILDRGRQISTGCGADAREQAEERLAEHIGAKRAPSAYAQRRADQTLIADVLSVYMDEVVAAKDQPKRVSARIGRLLDWWGEKTVAEVSPLTCREYAEERKRGGARRDLEDLRAAIGHHARRGLHTGFVEVELPAKGKPRTKYLTRDEVAKLLWTCWRHKRTQRPPRGERKGASVEGESFHDLRHLCRFILMGIYTGSRSTPIMRASIFAASGRAFLDLESGLYYRLPEDLDEAENKRSPTSRIPPRLMAHLERWKRKRIIAEFVVEWNGRPVKSVKTGWKTAVDLAKISGQVTPHTLRHTCVTWLKQAGVSSFDVGGFVGMSEAIVERVYGHHDPNFQGRVIDALNRRSRQ